jgi:hypothetical protein
MNLTDLKFHELANTFPLIDEEQTQELADDIKKRGLIEPLVLYEEAILYGRNRYNAAKLAGYKLKPDDVVLFEEEYDGQDPVAFVISRNIRRRHLTVGQRSTVAAELIKRMRKQQNNNNAPKKGDHSIEGRVETPYQRRLAIAAQVAQVSPKSVERVHAVMNADPGLHQEVRKGKKTLHEATQQVQRRKSEQQAKKVTHEEHDAAIARIKKICGPDFFTEVVAGKVGGLKSLGDVVAFAAKEAQEMKMLSWVMFWSEMGLSAAVKFRTERFNSHGLPEVDKSWTLQELLGLMGDETLLTEGFENLAWQLQDHA